MKGSLLRLRFDDDGDGSGKLIARAEADGFAGEGGAYFNIAEIERFATALGAFPLPHDDERLSIAGGFWSQERRDHLEQEHLGISVYPADARRGYIGIQVRMATELSRGSRPQSRKSATVEVVTTYEPLSRFGKDLREVLAGKLKEAVLLGEKL